MSSESARRDLVGWMLVGVQALLFLGVVVAALTPAIGPDLWASMPLSIAVIGFGALGMVLAGKDLGNALTPSPVPNGQGLAAAGVYRLVRHPMYTGVLLVCVGVAVGVGNVQTWLVVLAIAVFFEAKTRMEERFLVDAYPGYSDYAAQTGKFVPGLAKRSPAV